MHVRRLQLLSGARDATGIAVAIDVLRASSHIVTLLAGGARRVVPVATVASARQLKREHPDWILAGERNGLPPEGFDMGNSPVESARRELRGRSIILTTSAGSKGLVAAGKVADEVIVGCFLNAAAVVSYLRARQPSSVSLLALGVGGESPAPEDDGASLLISARLAGEDRAFDAIFDEVRRHDEGRKFLDPKNPNYSAEDLETCLCLDRYDLVPRLRGEELII